jgi:anthranilate synthase/aminodeoxychorismate synthase-like glutamine amidotransferase
LHNEFNRRKRKSRRTFFTWSQEKIGVTWPAMLLVIDNYDSFTYNLVQYLGELGVEMKISRNDEITIEEIRKLKPSRILISPGPCSPRESGLSNDVIKTFGPTIPTFGVCLGHQCMGHVFGGEVVRADRLMHGKTSPIYHNGRDLFAGMPNPFNATRYHSLLIKRDTLPETLEITAETKPEGEIMGIRHKTHPIWGVQFHPESILTDSGKQILANFLKLTK